MPHKSWADITSDDGTSVGAPEFGVVAVQNTFLHRVEESEDPRPLDLRRGQSELAPKKSPPLDDVFEGEEESDLGSPLPQPLVLERY